MRAASGIVSLVLHQRIPALFTSQWLYRVMPSLASIDHDIIVRFKLCNFKSDIVKFRAIEVNQLVSVD